MIRNLKRSGLPMSAALVLTVMFAASAQAEGAKGTFTTGATMPETHTASQLQAVQYEAENYFELFGNKIECASITLTSSTSDGTATKLTVTPHHEHCKDKSGKPVTIKLNGCDFILTQPTTVVPLDTGRYKGKADLTCPAGKGPTFEQYLFGGLTSHSFLSCTIEIVPGEKEEEGGGHSTRVLGGYLIYQNVAGGVGKKDDVTITATLAEIKMKRTGVCGAAEENAGTIKAKFTLTGKSEAGMDHDVWISDLA